MDGPYHLAHKQPHLDEPVLVWSARLGGEWIIAAYSYCKPLANHVWERNGWFVPLHPADKWFTIPLPTGGKRPD